LDKKTQQRIQNRLRELSIQTPEYSQALKDCKVLKFVGKYKNGKDKFRVHHTCAFCAKDYLREEVQVDHIIEVGQFDCWENWIERLFCESWGFQILCTRCHLAKTNSFMESIRLGTIYL